MTPPAPVGRIAFLLGFAGLLPPVLAVLVMVEVRVGAGHLSFEVASAAQFATVFYAGVILSFLGGMWWGFAMRSEAGQGAIVAVAVLPSLIAFACMGWAALGLPLALKAPAMVLGVSILSTLPFDRHLVGTGYAPANWMRLRVPLSVGLGGLTIAAGLLGG